MDFHHHIIYDFLTMEPKTCPHARCGYTWTPRKAEPVKCPRCQNPLWQSSKPKKHTESVGARTHLQEAS